ncbi:MAG: hypothetical protein PHS62_01985 [Patescibacteria group bacterium]|nr:hypothetical protein [Patescibacteria group bacterium]
MSSTITRVLTITRGPGRWSMMLAVFAGRPITFAVQEKQGQYLNYQSFRICGGNFCCRDLITGADNEVFETMLMAPTSQGSSVKVNVQCRFNLQTRQGKMENPAWVLETQKRATPNELALEDEMGLAAGGTKEAEKPGGEPSQGDALPARMVVGGRTYEIVKIPTKGVAPVPGHIMVGRVQELNVNLGQEDGEHILQHQKDIPKSLQGRVGFVFPAWRHSSEEFGEGIFVVDWDISLWVKNWNLFQGSFGGEYHRLLRRIYIATSGPDQLPPLARR